jgi:hypothetical protein
MRYSSPPKKGTSAQIRTQSHLGNTRTSDLLAAAANTVVKTPKTTKKATATTTQRI